MIKSTRLTLAMVLCFVFIAVNSMPVLAAPPEGKGKKPSYNPIQVYDANGNFIGIYIGPEPLVYIPDLDAVTQIELNIPGGPHIGDTWYGNIATASRFNYNNEDFSTLYLSWGAVRPLGGNHKMLVRNACGAEDQYYITKTGIVSIYQVHYLSGDTCSSGLEGTPGWYNNYELELITDIPFPVPIVGPLHYQFNP